MGEIKSTLDLIMERTAGMTLSAEEKERIHREELTKKAKGYRMRLIDDPARLDDILALLQDEPPADRTALEQLIWDEMVTTMPSDGKLLTFIDIMERFPWATEKSHLLAKLRAAFKAHQKSSGADRKRLLAQEKKKLAALGISGSAVVPKLPEEGDLSPEFLALLKEIKDQLMSLS